MTADTTGLIKGCDISAIQGNVDFPSLVAAGYQFCVFRCFVGNSNKDSLYDKNVAGATAAGLKVAAYHFIYPLPTIPSQPKRDPKVQAAMHVQAAGNVSVVCCDMEWPYPRNWAQWACSAPQIVEWVTTYLQEYERLSGIRPLVYTYSSFAQSIHLPASFAQTYKLWIASYTNKPSIPAPWTDWAMWQSSGGAEKLPNGVAVDIDYVKDLSLWDVAPGVPVPATSVPVQTVSTPDPVAVPIPMQTSSPADVVASAAVTKNNAISAQSSVFTYAFSALRSVLGNIFKS
jgi:GH25 family lysozyme M1 (1,4-beta-N-acetylmuramidase)